MGAIGSAFEELYNIIARLRGPDGCEWDKEQTPESMMGSLLEEAYETLEAIMEHDDRHLLEELGDVYLLITMLSYMKVQENAFVMTSVLEGISEKLVRRHPHVFGESDAKTPDEICDQWERIKEEVEGRTNLGSALSGIPKSLPPLERAYELQKKAAKVGFDWSTIGEVFDKVREELDELEQECIAGSKKGTDEEFGDLLFSLVNVSRFLKSDPAVALHQCNLKFTRRFEHIEERLKEENLEPSKDTFTRMDELWNEAKGLETSDR